MLDERAGTIYSRTALKLSGNQLLQLRGNTHPEHPLGEQHS